MRYSPAIPPSTQQWLPTLRSARGVAAAALKQLASKAGRELRVSVRGCAKGWGQSLAALAVAADADRRKWLIRRCRLSKRGKPPGRRLRRASFKIDGSAQLKIASWIR